MWLLRRLLFRWLWRRLTGRGAQEGRGRSGRGVASRRSGGGSGRGWPTGGVRERGRTGFLGPLPYYSARTRGGSRVAVTGCCLPLALSLLAVPALVLRAVLRR